jgi:4-hydroxy-tetrahydrodipicolinate synthase
VTQTRHGGGGIEVGFGGGGGWSGVFTALATPFTSGGDAVDLERLPLLLHRQADSGVAGVVPAGTTGEAPTLAEGEWRQLVEQCVQIARPRGLRIVAGAGSNSTAHAVHLHRAAAGCGADASLQVVPYYNRPGQEGLYRHFSLVAESADLPVILYSVPGRCGVGLEPETVERLAAHPNIVAIKEASGRLDAVTEIRRRCGISVLCGDDTLVLPALAVGACGVVSVVSNLLPAALAGLVAAALAGDFAEARHRHDQLFALSQALLRLEGNPVAVKAALRELGLDAGVVRPPLAEASAETVLALRALLREAGASRAVAEAPFARVSA